jgi:hypothetical protein
MRKPEFQKSSRIKATNLSGEHFGRSKFSGFWFGECVVPSDVSGEYGVFRSYHYWQQIQWNTQACEPGQQFAKGPAGRFRTNRWNVLVFSTQIAAGGRLGP